MMLRQIVVDLWPCTINYHQPNTQAMQQADIFDDVGKILMLDGEAIKHDDKCLASMSVNIGN